MNDGRLRKLVSIQELLPNVEPVPDTIPVQELAACEVCSDRGVIAFQVDYTDPRFGKFYPCPNPDCGTRISNEQRRYDKLLEMSGLDERYEHYTFETWERQVLGTHLANRKLIAYHASKIISERDGQPFWLREAWERSGVDVEVDRNNEHVVRYIHDGQVIKDWHEDSYAQGLILIGDYGVGKSGLASAVANHLLKEKQRSVVFRNVQYFIGDILNSYQHDQNTYTGPTRRDFIDSLVAPDVCVLDEFGWERAKPQTDHSTDIMREVVSSRWQQKKVIIATSNIGKGQMSQQWDRFIVSRWLGACHLVVMGGEPLRLQNSEQVVW